MDLIGLCDQRATSSLDIRGIQSGQAMFLGAICALDGAIVLFHAFSLFDLFNRCFNVTISPIRLFFPSVSLMVAAFCTFTLFFYRFYNPIYKSITPPAFVQ
jgi:hypothetical protein